MMDIVAFIRARIDEDERAALGAKGDTPGIWEGEHDPATWIVLYDASGKLTMGQDRHIARHDPARVLREVEATRRIVELHRPDSDDRPECVTCGPPYPCSTLRSLASIWDDHADYRGDWADDRSSRFVLDDAAGIHWRDDADAQDF